MGCCAFHDREAHLVTGIPTVSGVVCSSHLLRIKVLQVNGETISLCPRCGPGYVPLNLGPVGGRPV